MANYFFSQYSRGNSLDPVTGSRLDQLFRERAAAVDREAQLFGKTHQEEAGPIKKLAAALNAPAPTAPASVTLPNVPEDSHPVQMRKFAMMAGIFAALGSLLTRQPIVAALNAWTDGVKGFQAGDHAQYERKMQEWSMNMRTALIKQQQLNTQYQQAMAQRNMKLSDLTAQINLIAQENHDLVMQQQVKVAGITGAIQLENQRAAAAAKLNSEFMKVEGQALKPIPRPSLNDDMAAQAAVKGANLHVTNQDDLNFWVAGRSMFYVQRMGLDPATAMQRAVLDAKRYITGDSSTTSMFGASSATFTPPGSVEPGQPSTSAQASSSPSELPPVNAKGWHLMTDARGNKAYVSPDGKQYESVP